MIKSKHLIWMLFTINFIDGIVYSLFSETHTVSILVNTVNLVFLFSMLNFWPKLYLNEKQGKHPGMYVTSILLFPYIALPMFFIKFWGFKSGLLLILKSLMYFIFGTILLITPMAIFYYVNIYQIF